MYSVLQSVFSFYSKCIQFYETSSMFIRVMFSSTEPLLSLLKVYSFLLWLFFVCANYIQSSLFILSVFSSTMPLCQKISSLGHDILKTIHDFLNFQSVDHVLWAIIFLSLIRMHIKKRLATHSRLRWERIIVNSVGRSTNYALR